MAEQGHTIRAGVRQMANSLKQRVDSSASAVTCSRCEWRRFGTLNGRNEACAPSTVAGKLMSHGGVSAVNEIVPAGH